MDYLTLNSGARLPQLGFGMFKLDPSDTQRLVEDALEIGYRHFDTASSYGDEAAVGAALKASGIPRDELFVIMKLGNDEHRSMLIDQAFSASLSRLGLDQVDLYLIHWPMPAYRARGCFSIDRLGNVDAVTPKALAGFAAPGHAHHPLPATEAGWCRKGLAFDFDPTASRDE